MAVPMSTPDQISKHSYEEEAATPLISSCINSVYEISKCVKWIQDKGLKRVALQFPDSLLVDSPVVAQAIQVSLGQEVFILGEKAKGDDQLINLLTLFQGTHLMANVVLTKWQPHICQLTVLFILVTLVSHLHNLCQCCIFSPGDVAGRTNL